MKIQFEFRTERAAVLLAFILLMAVGMFLSLNGFASDHAGRQWTGGLLCGLSLGCWAWFLDYPKEPGK